MEFQKSKTEGKSIRCKAAVAWEPKKPLEIVEIEVAPPKKGEVRVKVLSNALCHTDIYTIDGNDPEGLFPCIPGHEACAEVESIGEGVTTVKVGDLVVPCFTPECQEKECIFCQSPNTNLCPKVRNTQGKGLMPDGTSRFKTVDGKEIFHFMGCSTFSEYTVIAEVAAAKINPYSDPIRTCLIGCGISTGWGAAMITTTVTPGSTVAVWGLGAVGLSVVQAAKIQGAKHIYGVDINTEKFEIAKKFGATECINPKDSQAKDQLIQKHKWGIDFTYDCTGNINVMREALETAHRGYGQSCVVGVAAAGKELATRPFQLVTGRQWKGTAFGGWKSRQDVPKLVNKLLLQEWPTDDYVTHQFDSISEVNKAIEVFHSGKCLRAVVNINKGPNSDRKHPYVTNNVTHFGGVLKTVKHWSDVNQCEMTFNIFLPSDVIKEQRRSAYPVLYYLSGLTCNHDNAPQKSGFGKYAAKHKIAMVFPDTSPRGVNIPGENEEELVGPSASFYIDATTDKFKKHYNMYTYITEELPKIVTQYFPVSSTYQSIMGHSMGGHGALTIAFKNQNKYLSVSVLAPICHPTRSERFGQRQFKAYLGSIEAGKEHDATELIATYSGQQFPLLVEYGTSDENAQSLNIDDFLQAAHAKDFKLIEKKQPYYGHGYYFISTVMNSQIKFHAKYLNAHIDSI